MVNVNNYSVGSANYTTGTNTQKSNQGQQIPANNSANSGSRPDDKYSFESNGMASGKVPPTVGMWDKMSSYFKDVMKTPQNLTAYKAFEQSIKNNPEGYLQPGTTDMGKIKDIQKKLNYLGMNLTINGQFGSATETAIIRFKNSVGINDGYMTKSGKMAVTPIVTPQVWSLLNAQVSNKMNPNANVRGGSYVTPVTSQEKDWARQLASKIQEFGYKPSEQERQRYENIYQRQQTNSAGASPTQQKQVAVPSVQEINWAKQLAAKVQSGYKPTAHEKNTYQDIFNRNKTANNSGSAQQTNNTAPAGPSQQELSWATDLMNKVKSGYKPNANESAKYQEIYQKTQGQNSGSVQTAGTTNNQPVTQQDVNWAQQLEAKVSQGYNPSPQERSKYDQIYAKTQGTNNVAAPATQQNQGAVSQQELDWALQLEAKNKQGYKPTQTELSIYNEIAQKVNGAQSQPTNSPAPQTTTNNRPQQSASSDNAPARTTNRVSNETFSYNQSTINSFKAAFPEATFKGRSVPYLPDNVARQVATQYGFSSVSELQSAIGAGVDGKFGPETFFKLNQVKNNQGSQQTEAPVDVNTNTVASAQNGVTQSELDWAVQLQDKFSQGYQANPQEQATYTDIFDRYQSSGNNIIPDNTVASNNASVTNTQAPVSGTAPSQDEVDWASNLQVKIGQGYQANAQETSKYTDIYNRYQSSGNQVAQTNYTPPAQATNNYQYSANVPTVGIDISSANPDVQWALQILDKVQQQGYVPNNDELAKYEQVMANNRSVMS